MADSIRAITPDAYADKAWRRYSDYRFAAGAAVVSLAGAEVSAAALELPLGFVADGETVGLVAVLGLGNGNNLFVRPDGHWAGRYVPATLRSHPFRLARGEGDALTLCFDEASGLLAEKGAGEAFFEADGSPSPAIQQILEFAAKVSRGQDAVNAAAALLARHNVLEPWPLKIKDGDAERDLTGLLRVNEAALGALDDAAFLALRQGGALALAYAQLLSMPNINLLGRLAQAHADYLKNQALTAAEQKAMFQATGAGDDAIDWDKVFAE